MKNLFLFLWLLPLFAFAQGTWQTEARLTTQQSAQQTRIWDNGRNIVVDSKDRIYITWMDERYDNSDIFLMKYENGSWQSEIRVTQNSSDSRNPSLLVLPAYGELPEQVWIAWVDNLSGQYEAYYKTYNTVTQQLSGREDLSVIGGNPLVFRVGSGTFDAKSGISMSASSNGSNVYIFYSNDLNNNTPGTDPDGRIQMRVFENGVLSSESQVPTSNGSSAVFPFSIHDNLGNTFISFNKGNAAYSKKRNSDGSWDADVLLSPFDPEWDDILGKPWISEDNSGELHYSWLGGKSGEGWRKIFYRKYIKSNNTWENIYEVDGDIGAGKELTSVVADKSNNIWIFWNDEQSNGYTIKFKRRTSSGWGSITDLVVDTISGVEANPPVCAVDSDNNIHLLWSDNRNSGNWDVYYKKMDAIPYAPVTLTYQNYNGFPKLIWNKSKSKDISSYKVYRNNGLIGTVSSIDSSFVDYDIILGSGMSYTYYVKAVDAISQYSAASPSVTLTGNMWKQGMNKDEVFSFYLYQNYPNPFNPITNMVLPLIV